jgi:hypothetical protein
MEITLELIVVPGPVVIIPHDILSLDSALGKIGVIILQPHMVLKHMMRVTRGMSAEFQSQVLTVAAVTIFPSRENI